jgi:uncharacterized membrane protein YbhN (UPF0104 family)
MKGAVMKGAAVKRAVVKSTAVKSTVVKRAWPWLRLLIALAILGALAWRLGTGAFVDGLRVISPVSILAALAIGGLTTVFSAWRWCLVARRLGLPLTLRTAIADYYQALFLNAVLPAGVLGDVHRAVQHGQQSGNVGRGVRAVVLERLAGQAVLIVVAVAVLLCKPAAISSLTLDFVPGRGVVTGLVAMLTVLVALVAWARWGRSTSAPRRAVVTALADARAGLLSRSAWPGMLALSAATMAGYIGLFVVAARTAGATASLGQLVPLVVLALLVMGLPINIGGFGPREAFLAVAFGAAGLGASLGVTTAVVYGVLSLAGSLPGVAVLFARRERQVRKPRLTRVPAPVLAPAR